MNDAAAPSGRRATLLLLALLAVLAAVAVTGVLVARDPGGAADAGGEWNALVGLDPSSAEVVLYDEDGEEIDRIDPGVEGLFSPVPRGSRVLLNGDDRSVVVDVDTGDVVWDGEAEGHAQWVPGTQAPVLTVGDPAGGDLRVVDVRSGTDLRLSEVVGGEPRFVHQQVRLSADGTLLTAVSYDPELSVVVDLESGEAQRVDGWAVAVTDEQAVVLAEEDGSVVARFVGRDGEEHGTAPLLARPQGVLVTGDDSLVAVHEADGGTVVSTTSAGADAASEVGSLDLTALQAVVGFPAQGRLVVSGEEGTVLLDEEGVEVAAVAGEALPMYGSVGETTECFTVRTDDELVLLDLGSGEERSRARHEDLAGLHSSADGCSIGGVGVLLGDEGPADMERSDVALVAPDGSAAIVRGAGGAELVDLSDPDGERQRLADLTSGFVLR